MDASSLSDIVRQVSYDIHAYLGHGHLEKVYENALVHRLTKCGLDATQQVGLGVFDQDGTPLGHYIADVVVEKILLVELKVTRSLAPEHKAQLLAYLRATRIHHGLLINFGAYRFEIRKFASPSFLSVL
jgi:GxxExxY protein